MSLLRKGSSYRAEAARRSYCNARGNGRRLPSGEIGTKGVIAFTFDDVPGYDPAFFEEPERQTKQENKQRDK